MKTLLGLVVVASALVAEADDFTFTGGAGDGDLSAAANWGGTLPGSDDNATVDGATAGRSAFTRSGAFSVGTFSLLNWSSSMLLDLNAGEISAGTFASGGAGPVVISNGTLNVSGKVSVGASSVLKIAKGATVVTPTKVAKNKELSVGANGTLVIDGGTYNIPLTDASDYGAGNTFGDWDNPGNLEIKNGGSFVAPSAGRAQVTAYSSRITVTGNSTFDVSKCGNDIFAFATARNGSVYAVTNSTFKWGKWCVGGNAQMGGAANNGRFYFHNSTVASSKPLKDDYNWGLQFHLSNNNQWLFDGADGTAAFSVHFGSVGGQFHGGSGNSITVRDGSYAGQIIFGGARNSFTLDGAAYTNGCSLSFAGEENVFRLKNSLFGAEVRPGLGGISNRLEIAGSTCGGRGQTINYTFNGPFFQYKLTDHAEGHIGIWGDNAAIQFTAAATNTLLSIDDSTLVTEGYVDLSGDLPPGIVFEFKGAAPLWKPVYWQLCRHALVTLGAADEAKKDEAPRFRFVLPETPYAKAPITVNDYVWFGVQLNPTAKLEFDFSQMGTTLRKRVYPLIQGACSGVSGEKTVALTEEQVEQIAANANLPEGCSLVYSNRTLSLQVKGTGGMSVIVR